MPKKAKKTKFPSELRFDLLSKDWVVIATGRAKRPKEFKREKRKTEIVSKDKCPFCKISTQERPTLIFNKGRRETRKKFPKEWTTVSIPNKYPAFIPYRELEERKEGEFLQKMNAVGFHEVVVTRDHFKSLGQFKLKEVKEVFDVYQQRYLDLMQKSFVNFVFIFHNHGPEAGASVFHPHSQIITTPLVDVDLKRALLRSEEYHKKTGECIYCQMNEWERKIRKRIVFENEGFIVVCPFASKSAFQMIVSPKSHSSHFEQISEKEKQQLAEAFGTALRKLHKGLGDPAYNFYLHTAPCDGKDYPYYHWHWTILPKTAIWAGFELGAKMEISVIEPERAAAYLRSQ
jgi:UDPglucose--hexose-1-phosphate uridylyltransferase